jgi:Tol biopolymer transport system component
VRSDGTVKVLDFGLAKAMEPAAGSSPSVSMSPTITTPAMTQAGMILGTAAYMSPEQAKGRAADKRSDVWAFGCVLFEMLTGTRAFEGEDVSDTLAAVLRGEPNWHALPTNIPSAIRTLIERCLAKDRRRRAADISVAQFVLTDPGVLADPRDAPARVPAPPSTPRWKSAVPIAAAVLATATLVGAGAWALRPSALAPPVARFSFTVPGVVATGSNVVAISPDGTEVAYAVNNRVFLRLLSEFDAHAIPGSESSSLVSSPTFSPDGRSIAFHVLGENLVKRIAVGGGAAVTICPATFPNGMAWDSAGDLLVGQGVRGIFSCSTNGGAPRQLATVKDGEQANGPQILPGGKALLFTIASAAGGAARWDKAQVVVQTLTSSARKTVVNGGSGARYLQTGHILYAVGGVVFAVRFDPVKQAVLSEPVPVLEGVRRTPGVGAATLLLDTSATGTLLYIPGPTSTTTAERALALADRSGAVTRLAIPPGPYVHVRASRDGRRLAIGSDDGKEANVLIYEVAGSSTARRLTFGGRNLYPIWSPDGQRVAFQSDREGDTAIFSQRADGTSAPERLTKPDKGVDHVPESWSPDGKTLLFSEGKGTSYALEALSLADKKAAPSGAVRSAEPIGAVFSPDGRWVAYASTPLAGGTSTNRGVYVQPFPSIGTAYQVPKQQLDFHPTWGPKGTELFYVPTAASGQLAAVSVTTQPSVTFGTPTNLPATVMANRTSVETRAYDVLPDGKFVGVVSSSELDSLGAVAAPQIRVVLNWFDELKARVPTK